MLALELDNRAICDHCNEAKVVVGLIHHSGPHITLCFDCWVVLYNDARLLFASVKS